MQSMHAHCTPAHYCRLLDHLGDKCPKTINLMWPNTVYTAHTNIAAGGLQCLVRYKNQLYFKLIIFQRKTLKKKRIILLLITVVILYRYAFKVIILANSVK